MNTFHPSTSHPSLIPASHLSRSSPTPPARRVGTSANSDRHNSHHLATQRSHNMYLSTTTLQPYPLPFTYLPETGLQYVSTAPGRYSCGVRNSVVGFARSEKIGDGRETGNGGVSVADLEWKQIGPWWAGGMGCTRLVKACQMAERNVREGVRDVFVMG